MAKHKVLVLGGGIAGLTSAFELSKTQALRDAYDVEVVSLGWRVGGKLASGRNTVAPFESHEHGLHVWFGFYDNAFALLREIYARWQMPASCPFRTWEAVLRPQSLTPVGGSVFGEENLWNVRWPTNPGVPGDGDMRLTPWESFVEFLNLIEIVVEDGLRGLRATADETSASEDVLRRLGLDLGSIQSRAALPLLRQARDRAKALIDDDLEKDARRVIAAVITALLKAFQLALTPFVLPLSKDNVDAFDLLSVIECGCAFARGILNPDYGIIDDGDLDRVDHLEFRTFLTDNGCDADVASSWRGIKALYDTTFQYKDGDVARPDFAAGTAARVMMRIVTQYKGAVIWLFNAGVGEAVIAPLYEVLVQQGVTFRFFSEVKSLTLNDDKTRVGTVVIDEQVQLASAAPYAPLFDVMGFRCWPIEPFWDQLENGAALKAAGVDFESPWGTNKPTPVTKTLRSGVDYDTVVLATAVGAFKRLNDVDTPMIDEILRLDNSWRRMCETTCLAPTVSLELWMKKTTRELGFTAGAPAAVGIPYPHAVWADMSQVIDVELWPEATEPKSLHYFCGTLGTDLYARPRSESTVPAQGFTLASTETQTQLDTTMATLWPLGVLPGTQQLDPSLVALRTLRANIAPTECCETSPTGSAKHKLAADRSGFANLVLAGAWVRTGINASCVEAGVMSGMQASRAICGEPVRVVGEHYWHRFPAPGPGPKQLPKYISRYGHGEQAVPPPGIVRGAKTSCFFVPASHDAMQACVDQFLNAPATSDVEYEVIGSSALLSFLDGDALSSLAQVMGSISDREVAFWIPLLQKKRGQWLPEIVLWMPYVVVDQSIACVTGREGWGFLKEVGSLEFPGDTGGSGDFVANAMTFLQFSNSEVGQIRPLIRVHHPDGAGKDATTVAATVEDAVSMLADNAVDAALARKLLTVGVPLVNLKQFPAAENPDLACYQALVASECRVETLRSVTLLQSGHLLDILPCASHRIVQDLGLASASNVPLWLGIRVDMDFSVQLGHEVWRGT